MTSSFAPASVSAYQARPVLLGPEALQSLHQSAVLSKGESQVRVEHPAQWVDAHGAWWLTVRQFGFSLCDRVVSLNCSKAHFFDCNRFCFAFGVDQRELIAVGAEDGHHLTTNHQQAFALSAYAAHAFLSGSHSDGVVEAACVDLHFHGVSPVAEQHRAVHVH